MDTRNFLMTAGAVAALSLGPGLATAQSDTATLDQSDRYIVSTITSFGAVSFTSTVHDSSNNQQWSYNRSVTISNVRTDPDACTIKFHFTEVTPGHPSVDKDAGIPLNLTREVRVMTLDEEVDQINADSGHPTWLVTSQPEVYVVHVIRTDGKTNDVDFNDLGGAQRVAVAIRRAAQLCGGGLG
jgi:hypothetical protein